MAIIFKINPHEDDLETSLTELAIIRGGITVKPHVQKLADDLDIAMGGGLSFGTYAGHSPPEGPTQAIDVFTPDNANGYILQDRICAWLIQHQAKYGVRYCIRRHMIWNIERANEGWRDQGVTGNRTADHYDHVHVTCYASVEVVDDGPVIPPMKGDVMALSVRYIWGARPSEQVDWVFDGPSRIHAAIGDTDILKACDLSGVKEMGKISTPAHNWFQGQAEGWR